MVIFSDLLFNGLTSRTKAIIPAINGNSIITSPSLGLRLRTLKSFGLAIIVENNPGLESDFMTIVIIRGKAPMVFDTMRTTANITI
jgi:hypothetical protein